jgi:hypothetical protein
MRKYRERDERVRSGKYIRGERKEEREVRKYTHTHTEREREKEKEREKERE